MSLEHRTGADQLDLHRNDQDRTTTQHRLSTSVQMDAFIYHGAKEMGRRPVYRLGVAMIDLEDPRKVLARASDWVFGPEADYENQGLVPGVVFTSGAVCRGNCGCTMALPIRFAGLAIAKTADLVSFAFEHDYLRQIGREKGMVGQRLQDKSCCPDQSASDLPPPG